MLNKSSLVYLSRFAIIPAVLYSLPVIFFLKDRRFSDTWLLYVGSALFLCCIFAFGIMFGGKIGNAPDHAYNGFVVTILGVIFSCILILLLSLIITPEVFHFGSGNDALQQTPAAISKSGTHGLLFILLANAIIINFCGGIFSTVMAKGKNAEKNLPPNE
ncbi:MAG: hypothetical protein ABI285_07885 [Ginsengibacter sp.]